MSQDDMYSKQYKVVAIISDNPSDMDKKVFDAIKEIGLASSDDIVEKIIPNYKNTLNPKNAHSLSLKQRLSKANELRSIAFTVVQIDNSLKKLIKNECVSQNK
jgi:hypothetical protein